MPAFYRYVFLCFSVLIVVIPTGCATTRPSPLTVSQVVDLSKEGVPSGEIINRMKESRASYPLEASQLARLKEQGVSDPVIDYMQQTYLTEARREQELQDRALWPGYWGPPGPWGPYDRE
ncbi:MAG: hypothetical protein A4E57_00789 [Syntrophorhabdaceae bacterium PtaU1.Bin034]|jgi:hypothetical protein|nr:MAG: hypothetical protein A4E57_00789 [Syntrophorhabdaceae bacterium PtaU1.Bin034]